MFSNRPDLSSTSLLVTGEFSEEGLKEDATDLTPTQILGVCFAFCSSVPWLKCVGGRLALSSPRPWLPQVYSWLDFMKKTYTFEGHLVGVYYDDAGEPTPALLKVQELQAGGRAVT